MDSKDKIEKARDKLHQAICDNCCKEKILKYSRQVDKHIVDYYKSHYGKDCCQDSKGPKA